MEYWTPVIQKTSFVDPVAPQRALFQPNLVGFPSSPVIRRNYPKGEINHHRIISLPKPELTTREKRQLMRTGRTVIGGLGRSMPLYPAVTRRNAVLNPAIGVISISAQTQKGRIGLKEKDHNQDCYLLLPQYQGRQDSYLVTLADGHGPYGHVVATKVCELVSGLVATAKDMSDGELHREATGLFRGISSRVHRSVLQSTNIIPDISGCTLLTALIQNHTLVVSHLGDCRALLIQSSPCAQEAGFWVYKQLTEEHRPDLPLEKARIENKKGVVASKKDSAGKENGPARVWVAGEGMPGLAMSRSIGDSIAHSVGVSDTPDVILHRFDQRDKALVVASDGLWNVLSNSEVTMIVQRQWSNCDSCSLELLKAAENRWKKLHTSSDDITVIVITLSF